MEQTADVVSVESSARTSDKNMNLTTDGEVKNNTSGETIANSTKQTQETDSVEEVHVSRDL